MPSEKIIGYVLLGVGIFLMLVAAFQIILVFTGKAQPIKILNTTAQNNNQNTSKNIDSSNPDELLKQIQEDPLSLLSSGGGVSLPNLIDPTVLYQMLNLTVYYFIMQFMLGFGYKLASLGVQMVRPLKISVDQNRISNVVNSTKNSTQ
ncbi:MAG: hypothetical protein US54_C0001G0049 [Candidatus Roizmanbacteria bacterium GW2011_GWA2_37_7]|uniref:Uncharacterized protein n=1 Tax=Candidatus Roizmanbacteria bacterium GW2011_GWA2_37_7 TaxID=1618481 RepID=A0A0G0JPS5_9BACT|nr:MAG: hypothetical protein US54_C0001G0049 [Candidatus Roizmanbacteria bacterium GW2011_GWA2_37_7]